MKKSFSVRRLVISSAFLLSLSGPSLADMAAGASAYAAGNYTVAFNEFSAAAEQGDARAQHNLGAMYDKGQGVQQDYSQAVYWYRKAAEQGIASAQNNLGVLYENGLGLPQNNSQAVYWLRKAADQGHADAQNNLGLQYAMGQGVPQNSIAAYALANVARANGATKAASLINLITKNIPSASITQAQSLSTRMAKKGALLRELDKFMATRKKQ